MAIFIYRLEKHPEDSEEMVNHFPFSTTIGSKNRLFVRCPKSRILFFEFSNLQNVYVNNKNVNFHAKNRRLIGNDFRAKNSNPT